jgi:hypothetical protein
VDRRLRVREHLLETHAALALRNAPQILTADGDRIERDKRRGRP